MAFIKYFEYLLPAVLHTETIFYQRYCLCTRVCCFKIDFICGQSKCMAFAWTRRYRTIMSKYYWSFVVAFAMSMFVVLYYCFNEDVLTDDGSNNNLNVFQSMEFDTQSSSPDSKAKNSQGKELTSKNCKYLHEIAMDMLYNGEKILLPFETNKTRWTFHKRGNLDYLNQISKRWSQPQAENFSLRHFKRYSNIKSKDLKAKKYFITFACRCCEKSKIKAIKAARDPGGFDFTTVHDLNSLSKRFRHTHSDILKLKRGCGFWLWKPYIILKTLIESMLDGDLLMYQDAGAHLIQDAGPLLKLCQDIEPGIVLFHTKFLENVFTKRDAFILMDMQDVRVYQSYQRLASFLVLRKNCQTLQFVMEWLAYASDARILTDSENEMGKPDFPTFRENRHDQTVLSLLSKKWQLNEYRDPSQYGNIDHKFMYELGPYKQIIYHTRDTS